MINQYSFSNIFPINRMERQNP